MNPNDILRFRINLWLKNWEIILKWRCCLFYVCTYIKRERILHGRAEIWNFSSICWKIFHEWAQITREIFFFNTKREISYLQANMSSSIYYININEIPNHFTQIVFWCERCDLFCSHSNGDIFTCEHVKFSRESSPGILLVFV